MSHYDWLEKHFKAFALAVGVGWAWADGIISAHGDKCYNYRGIWQEAGIPFSHGVAIYLLTYLNPFAKEVRETKDGWVAPADWVVRNYGRFKEHLPKE